MAIVKLVVKANVVPVRTLTLKRMLERFDVGRTVLPCLDAGCSASSHVVALDSESIARLWRRFVEVLRASIEELVKLVKEVNEARRREGRGIFESTRYTRFHNAPHEVKRRWKEIKR